MKSEEKLNHLFETLRSEKAATSVSDVTSWIEASAQVTVPKSTGKITIQKNFFIMSSIATIIVAGILLVSNNEEPNIAPSLKEDVQATIQDSSAIIPDQPNHVKFNNEIWNNPFIQPLKDSGLMTLPFVELPFDTELVQTDSKIPSPNSTKTSVQSNVGSWFSSNDSLYVDTLFKGVKLLVFKGDKSDILVQGSDRSDVAMKYNYQLKAKGVFSRKKERNVALRFELKDSVLMIHLEREEQKINGVSVISENSTMEFNVPENIDVKMDSDLGDIEANGLKNKNTILHTALGDISAKNMEGAIDFETDLGDISMSNLKGKILCFTSLGDVTGENITVKDECKLESSLGDIDVQLSNPLSECRLDLSTSLGKVKVDRPELKKKASSQLSIGNGKLRVVMETALGKVIVR